STPLNQLYCLPSQTLRVERSRSQRVSVRRKPVCKMLVPTYLVRVLGVAEMEDEQIGGTPALQGLAKIDSSQASATSDFIPICCRL
ncbi:MAG: hypothetical protein AAFR26_26700, partial [Cyanobacteria bacterium J06626_4]